MIDGCHYQLTRSRHGRVGRLPPPHHYILIPFRRSPPPSVVPMFYRYSGVVSVVVRVIENRAWTLTGQKINMKKSQCFIAIIIA